MPNVLNFYLDDSGTRYPDHKPGKRAGHGYDWFALGGILIENEREPEARKLHSDFCAKWKITYPLHSVEIRGKTKKFRWLQECGEGESRAFHEELYLLIKSVPVIGLACVIDRPGYNARYKEKYSDNRWLLCKTAFSVAVERASKYALTQKRRLRVSPERCNKVEDAHLESYYDAMKSDGMPFAQSTSDKYGPLSAEQFKETLYEFRPKQKTSPMAQLADLYLWPICMGGYHASNRPYQRLKEDGKLIECVLPEEAHGALASKYSCFEQVTRKP
jgi:Protein of unknown function (DUF3800)